MSISKRSTSKPRVRSADANVLYGRVCWEPLRSLWLLAMTFGAIVGVTRFFSWTGFAIYVVSTLCVLLFGHSLGMHRKLIHDSFSCPKWLEYALVYCGVLVGLAGPLGLLRTHDLRDFAQRQRDCHDFLAHRQPWLVDGWWQLHCELRLDRPPQIDIEASIASDCFYRFLQSTWMLQQLPWAVLLWWLGGWSFVCWGVCARVVTAVSGHWLVGWFAHNRGELHHEVPNACAQGYNVHMMSLLTMGECWHNNHHAFPESARIGLYCGQWDPGWWMLLALRRIGLVAQLRLPAEADQRISEHSYAVPTTARATRRPPSTLQPE